GEVLNEYKNSKSKGLNDVTVADDGSVFISDSDGNCIFKIENGSMNVFVEDDRIRGMNGIYAEGDLLYVGGSNNFFTVNQKNKEIEVIAEEVGYLDGIEKVAEGVFATSDWQGQVYLIEPGKGTEKILDTTPKEINAADLGFIPDNNLLLVPTFNNNKVIAYQLDMN
ncbi:MAG TPA: hypothetical protein VEP89_03205, partial [Draconibacterium sp.]|nr:hypothetical protein [Draconibacterium sp.]